MDDGRMVPALSLDALTLLYDLQCGVSRGQKGGRSPLLTAHLSVVHV